jgi:hypothetical protein
LGTSATKTRIVCFGKRSKHSEDSGHHCTGNLKPSDGRRLAGIYGMNFEQMPELKWAYGYYIVVGAILSVCTILYFRFRHYGWL